jgi:hypothetical protein
MLAVLALSIPLSYAVAAAAGLSNNLTLNENILEDKELDSKEDTLEPAVTARPKVVVENRRLRE